MKKTKLFPRKAVAALSCLAALCLAGPVSAQLTVTNYTQQGSAGVYPFTPTWTPAANSLIAGLAPTVAVGNFGVELTNRDVLSLTAGGSLSLYIVTGNADDSVGHNTTCTNYVVGGNRNGSGTEPGSLLVYTLPASAHGYNLTNITVDGGWADNGRDGQTFTVLYSTAVSPGHFMFLTNVSYNPSTPSGTAIANQSVIFDPSGGVIASNVDAVEFILNAPNSENGFVGYGAITVQGTPATTVISPVISVTTSNEAAIGNFVPDWTAETPNLIAGMAPSAAAGNFTQEGSAGTNILTDGFIGTSGDISTFATCGASGGTSLVYSLTNVVNGTDVTNIITYSGWGNDQRAGQYYTVSYSTVAAPTTYIPITTVCYNPYTNGAASANRVAIAMSDGSALAKGVANIKFDFASPARANAFNNNYQGYSEIIIEGKDSTAPPPPPSAYLTQDLLPTRAETVAGDQVVFTASYSNFPPVTVQWQQITTSPAATNNINTGVVNVVNNGVLTSTLTLNNVQAASAGVYRLVGNNATNSSAAPSYTSAATLAVGTPTIVGNVSMSYAGQTGPAGFYPAWSIVTNLDLIFGFPTDGSGNPGTATAGPGNYGNEAPLASDPTLLADGYLTSDRTGMVSLGWVNVGAGQSMTYTLPTSAHGYDITNIAVYGGWPDDGRNEQKYQVLYSTVSAPTTFTAIGTFDYNPSFSSGEPNSTRTILVPISGALAQNVYALQFNFNLQSKNNWNGYSEITVGGKLSSGVIPTLTTDITPLTAEDVVGSSLTLTANFSGATSYQWQKNGTNIAGATSTTLTLNNLQVADTATNGGYRLLGINGAGTNFSRGCAVIVDLMPAAVSNVVTAFAYQTSDASAPNTFAPTWSTAALANSLIYQQNPPSIDYGTGNFNDPDQNFPNSAGGLPVLTDGNYGVFAFDGSHPAFAAAGPNAGQYVVYSLGASATGYDITNIQVAGGWNDNGRNSQFYTVSYATPENPTTFIPIKAVSISPTFAGESVIRTTITPASGLLASNAYALKVDFTQPGGVPNGYSGYSEISAFGAPSAKDTQPYAVTVENQNPAPATAPTWTVETSSLIEGQQPSSVGTGAFAGNFNNEAPAGGLPVLTDGTFGPADASLSYATCGGAYGAGSSITYTCNNGAWTITNIVVYSGWGNYDRDGQFYNITYTTTAAPSTPIALASVQYNPPALSGSSANRVNIAPANGATVLATNVASITFDFTPQTAGLDNGYSGYAEIVLQGSTASVPTLPKALGATLVGGKLVITGTNGSPNAAYSVLTSTNLLTPIGSWTVSATGTLDASGGLSNAIPVDPAKPAGFFRVRIP